MKSKSTLYLLLILSFFYSNLTYSQSQKLIDSLIIRSLDSRLDLQISSGIKYIEPNEIAFRIKNEIKYPFKFSYGKELFNEAYRKNNHSLTLYRIYPKTISKDTIDINIAPISMKARKGVFFKPKKLHFKKVEINIPCGGTNGYQPDFRYVYNSEINTWINIAPKFKLD